MGLVAFVFFDHGPGVVVMDRFEVFGFDAIPSDRGMLIGFDSDVAHYIFYEDGVVVGGFGDKFFVWAFEDRVELSGSGGFDEVDEFFDPDGGGEAHGEGDDAALVVGAAFADGFGAGAERGDRDFDGDDEVGEVGFCVDFENDAVVEQAWGGGDGGGFGAEVGEAEFEVSALGVET